MLIRLVLLTLALQTLNQPPQPPPPTGDDFDWVDKHLSAARDQLMPMGAPSPAAAYRATKDMFTDAVESYFSIDRTYRDPAEPPNEEVLIATVTTPAPDVLHGRQFAMSIREQLLELHMADRSASLEVVLLGANVRRTTLTAEECPAIARRMNGLRAMALVLPGPDSRGRPKPPILHPTVHEIIVNVEGAYIKNSFSDPDVSLVSGHSARCKT